MPLEANSDGSIESDVGFSPLVMFEILPQLIVPKLSPVVLIPARLWRYLH